jgi:hypothetical protein
MTDLFSAYAQGAIPASVQRRQAKAEARAEKAPSALDLKMAEKQRLNKMYRAWRRDHNRAVLASEPRLVGFMRYLKTITPETADELLEAIRGSWLVAAVLDVRIYALRMIDARANRINRMLGNDALNDPLPPATTVYFMARDLLHNGGRS